MRLWVKNADFTREGLIENFESLIWTKRYWECGDFELYLPASETALDLLKQDRYLVREDDDAVMIIERLEITTDSEDGNHLIVSGRSLESILTRRIVWEQTTYKDTPELVIYGLLRDAMIAPAAAQRKIDSMGFVYEESGNTAVSMQFTGTDIYDAVTDICKDYGFGFKLTENLVFTLYIGKDRSLGQNKNARVIFSPTYGNLLESDYFSDKEEYKTIVRIAGEGEGSSRAYATYGTGAKGINRRELFVDARDLQKEDSEGNVMTAAEYHNALIARAKEQYAQHRIDTAFSGTIDTNGAFVYRKDYDLGDIVTVQNEYGMTENCRIVEVIENWDSTGYKAIPKYERVNA